MPIAAFSLAIVGADYPNKRGPARRFELALCARGEPIELCPEPKNPKDEYAVAVYSVRGVQLGYVPADRAPWVRKLLAERDMRCVFQGTAAFGGWIRCAFDGEEPTLPSSKEAGTPEDDSGFWPDPEWPDE